MARSQWGLDTNGDGTDDATAIDTTGDGKPNQIINATKGAKPVCLDTTGDGKADSYAPLPAPEALGDLPPAYASLYVVPTAPPPPQAPGQGEPGA